VCEAILGDRPCFRSLQYMMNPAETSTDGNWHRDAPLDSVPAGPVPLGLCTFKVKSTGLTQNSQVDPAV
jgi:hypothetical protein